MSKQITHRQLLSFAIKHPWHIVIFSIATVVGVAYWNIYVLMAAFLVSEAVMLATVFHFPVFRLYLQEIQDEATKLGNKKIRGSTLETLSHQDRQLFHQLETKIENWERQSKQLNYMASSSLMESLRSLLKLFLSLALENARVSGARVSFSDLDHKICVLQNELKTTKFPGLVQSRIEGLQEHRKLLNASFERKVEIEHLIQSTSECIDFTIDHGVVWSSNPQVRIGENKVISHALTIEQQVVEEMREFLDTEETGIDLDAVLQGK